MHRGSFSLLRPPPSSVAPLTLSRSRGVADAGDDLLPRVLIGAPASRTAPFQALCLPATLAFALPPWLGDPWLSAGCRKKERRSTFHDVTSAYGRSIKGHAHPRLKFTLSPLSSCPRYSAARISLLYRLLRRTLIHIKYSTRKII